MGNSSSRSKADSRPARAKEIDREYDEQMMKIRAIKSANVDDLKAALTEASTKNKELQEAKWTVERLNAQLDSTNHLNRELNLQISNTLQKYNSAVLVFSGIVCLAVLLFLWLLRQQQLTTPSSCMLNEEAALSTASMPASGLRQQSILYAHPGHSNSDYSSDSRSDSRVLLVTATSLYAALQQHYDITPTASVESVTTLSTKSFEALWRALGEQSVPVSYSTLLSLVTRVFAPSLSLGLVATCVGVLIATLAACFSVLFFWKTWDGPTQLLTSLLYMIGFTSAGVYMHQTARDPALQIPGGSLVALGCCAVYLVVLALFKTGHASSGEEGTEEGGAERRHREYREDPLFRFVAVLAVGAMASGCLRVIPFAPLGLVIVSAGAWFVIFTISLSLKQQNQAAVGEKVKGKEDTVRATCTMGGGVFGYSLSVWVVFNPHAGVVSVYTLFPQAVNVAYPLVTDVALWVEWSACLWGFIAVLGMAVGFLSNAHSHPGSHSTVICVSAMVYVLSLGALYVGVQVKSLAMSVMGHLSVVLFHCISLSAPMPLLAAAHGGLVLASGLWQSQTQELVGPLETLSGVVLGPLGVCMLTLYASACAATRTRSGGEQRGGGTLTLPLQALVMNLALLAWGTYVSRTLMFLTGLAGIAVFIIHLGLTFMKGSASFVMLLVLLAFLVATFGILWQ